MSGRCLEIAVRRLNKKPTLHMRRIVLRMMSSMMKFSKGGDVTSLQMWYRAPTCVSGT